MIFVYMLIFSLLINFSTAESPRWDLMRQNRYTASVHHADVAYVNKTYLEIEKFEFVKFNRTSKRVFNGSMTLFKELGNNITIKSQFFKLHGNEYKFFPFTASFQVCDELARNSFKLKELLATYTNLHLCPQKPGHLYAINYHSDPSRYPPLMPSGDYKLNSILYHKSDTVLDINVFGSIIYNN